MKTAKNGLALLHDLNKAADDGDEGSADEDGNVNEHYFFTEHRARDLDCFFDKSDLSNVSRNDLKRVMRFEEDDLIFSSQLLFLYTRQGIQNLDGTGKKISTLQKFVLK